jgi:hypothetical protein
MPEVDIGPFTGTTGPEGAKETVRFLRIGSFTSNTVKLPETVEDVAAALVCVSELLRVQESKLAELILSFRQGEVGFEADATGKVTRWYFKYPDFGHVEGGLEPS